MLFFSQTIKTQSQCLSWQHLSDNWRKSLHSPHHKDATSITHVYSVVSVKISHLQNIHCNATNRCSLLQSLILSTQGDNQQSLHLTISIPAPIAGGTCYGLWLVPTYTKLLPSLFHSLHIKLIEDFNLVIHLAFWTVFSNWSYIFTHCIQIQFNLHKRLWLQPFFWL